MGKRTVAIILAGGEGKRMGADIPKQFLDLSGKPLIVRTLERFSGNAGISDVVIVCHRSHMDRMKNLVKENNVTKIFKIVPGGATRQESSFEGVKNCPSGTEYVLIHDAVRPFATDRIIGDVLREAVKSKAAAPAVPPEDTIIVCNDDIITDIPARKSLRKIQTPQGFSYEVIYKAHMRAYEEGITDLTDDCGLVMVMGGSVKVVDGNEANIKITGRTDLLLAERLIRAEGGPDGPGKTV